MKYLGLSFAVLLFTAGSAFAVIQDTLTFEFVFSDGPQGDPFNDLRFTSTLAVAPYTINSIAWDGLAFPLPDPTLPDSLPPSWSRDLSARITHDQSGNFAEFQLGPGGFFFPGPVQFTGLEFSLFGTVVFPNDTFTFEFYEFRFPGCPSMGPCHNFIGIDAEWDSIIFDIDDITADPAPALSPGMIRVDANGRNAFGTSLTAFPETVNFWGIQYAPDAGAEAGDAPAITSVEIKLSEDASVYWDPEQNLSPPLVGSATVGIETPPVIEFDDEGPQIPDTFTTATLTFEPGVFLPGDTFRFGADFDAIGFDVDAFRITAIEGVLGTFGGEIPGAELANQSVLDATTTVTITFENGGQVTGTLDQLAAGEADGEFFSFVDLEVAAPPGNPADFDKDGDVDGDDFLIWQTNFGTQMDATSNQGDSDGDGDVDGDDFLAWQAGFGAMMGGEQAATAVPEPASWILVAMSILAVSGARRRR